MLPRSFSARTLSWRSGCARAAAHAVSRIITRAFLAILNEDLRVHAPLRYISARNTRKRLFLWPVSSSQLRSETCRLSALIDRARTRKSGLNWTARLVCSPSSLRCSIFSRAVSLLADARHAGPLCPLGAHLLREPARGLAARCGCSPDSLCRALDSVLMLVRPCGVCAHQAHPWLGDVNIVVQY